MKQKLTIVIVGLTIAAPAYAYIDPGSISIVMQTVAAVIIGAVVSGRIYWAKIKSLFQKSAAKTQESVEKK